MLLASILILSILAIGVSQAEAYDGKIKIADGKLNDLIIGEEFGIEGVIGTGDLIPILQSVR